MCSSDLAVSRSARADSGERRNKSSADGRSGGGGEAAPVEGFARPLVEFEGDSSEVLEGVDRQVGALREVLAE